MSFPRKQKGVVAWVSFTSVIPWLDHGIQLKILKLLVFFIVFMDLVSNPRGDTVGLPVYATMPCGNDIGIHTTIPLIKNKA
ncbi:hypothetical protein [Candidatus Rickettsia kedanie]|uniref:hypothetical protein n=1 Tax=Candidatus Rickettsia kedanie TaxID=3115352 RepID=UPI00399C6084